MNQGKGIGGHQSALAKSVDWLTPPEILHVLGRFDLDPCASPTPRPWETADTMWSEGGLQRPWFGRVWLNPPYGKALGVWLERLAQHGHGIAIAFARTETRAFFQHVWPKASALLFLEGRPKFYRPNGVQAKANSGGPIVLIAYGTTNAYILKTCGLKGAYVENPRLT